MSWDGRGESQQNRMLVYVVGEMDEVEQQPEQELKDDRCRRLEEKIRLKDANIAAVATQMDTLMAQLRTTSGVEPVSGLSGSADRGASTSTNMGATSMNPQQGFVYDPMAFPSVP